MSEGAAQQTVQAVPQVLLSLLPIPCQASTQRGSRKSENFRRSKEGGLHYMEGAYILVFIRNGANLAHFFRQMPIR
jgi:hypothetical protein